MKEEKSKLYILKINQEKAFDKVDHQFLFKIMNKWDFRINLYIS